ncbi:MAG: protein phosphatase 2C domain-containing protein [Candidatus Brennerbacteria bacterium]|nr:protein phosphatase 2C domain-containing protein [Candidatus Brennerbacteria bacterium]
MRFLTDHYFQIGHSHYVAGKPCQDYALSRSSEIIACAIVSDGCSTGGNTDVGSRILAFGTLQAIRDHAKASNGSLDTAVISIVARQQQLIETVRPMLGLNRSDMLATCVYAYITRLGALIHIQGDGVIGIKYRSGWIDMHRFDWAKNAPFYPSYNDEEEKVYIINLHEGIFDTAVMSHVRFWRSPDGIFEKEEISQISFSEGRNGFIFRISAEDLSIIEFIAVFTDGVSQIGSLPNGNNLLDWRRGVTEFLSFKNNVGEFAKRRMIRGIKDMHRIGNGPIDDISFAVIHIETDGVGKEDTQ